MGPKTKQKLPPCCRVFFGKKILFRFRHFKGGLATQFFPLVDEEMSPGRGGDARGDVGGKHPLGLLAVLQKLKEKPLLTPL